MILQIFAIGRHQKPFPTVITTYAVVAAFGILTIIGGISANNYDDRPNMESAVVRMQSPAPAVTRQDAGIPTATNGCKVSPTTRTIVQSSLQEAPRASTRTAQR